MRAPVSAPRPTTLALLCALVLSGCASTWGVEGSGRLVATDDGAQVAAFELWPHGAPDQEPRGWVVHVHGSQPAGVRALVPRMASVVAMGFRPLLIEHRGVDLHGQVAADRAPVDPERRRRDVRAAIDATLPDLAERPLILIGAHEGAPIAQQLAARDPRVTQMILLTPRDAPAVARGLAATELPTLLVLAGADEGLPASDAERLRAAARLSDHVTLRELPGLRADLTDVSSGVDGYPRLELVVLAFLEDADVLTPAERQRFARRVHRAHPELFDDSPARRR